VKVELALTLLHTLLKQKVAGSDLWSGSKEGTVADAAPAAPAPEAPKSSGSGGKPTLFIILAIINMLVVVGVGVMLFLGQKKKAAEPGIDDVIKGEKNTLESEEKSKEFIGKLVPLETFLVNLSGAHGRKLLKINMELEVNNGEVQEEIEKIKPKIRDYIIIIVSSKSFAEVSTKEGKDALREEIKNQINLFLTKGQINKVFFTEFLSN
jgi:flagellar FliL protein